MLSCGCMGSHYEEPLWNGPDIDLIDNPAAIFVVLPVVAVMAAEHFPQAVLDEREVCTLESLTGTLIEPPDTPVANASLEIRRAARLADDPAGLPVETMQLGPRGTFAVPVNHAAVLYVRAKAPGHVPVDRAFVVWTRENARHLPAHLASATAMSPSLATTGNLQLWMEPPAEAQPWVASERP
jgi:hypothetical protein